jgi:hypothetical protein
LSIEIKASDTLHLKKDESGYVNIQLYRNVEGIEAINLTLTPKQARAPHINQTVVFVKEKYLEVLKSAGIITEFFKPQDIDAWCAFLDINVFFELDNSPSKMLSKKVKEA